LRLLSPRKLPRAVEFKGTGIVEKDAQKVWIKVRKDSERYARNGEKKKSYKSRTKAIEENRAFIL
jgi:hypothetical protein